MIKFKLYREYGALNSKPVFDAFERSITKLGYKIVTCDEDVSVIWSLLFRGRMANNKYIFNNGNPIIILEVGSIIRNYTWKFALNHLNNTGYYGNNTDIDYTRYKKINVSYPVNNNCRKNEILIAGQHINSQLCNVNYKEWVLSTIQKIKQHTDRQIIFRPHPRCPIDIPKLSVNTPVKINNTYDSFDIDFNYHLVVNYNSGVSIQAGLTGIPVVCDQTSMAYPVSVDIDKIDDPPDIDRYEWFHRMMHTEWTLEEMENAIPLRRILNVLTL